MIPPLFRCPTCRQHTLGTEDRHFFPICSTCYRSLVPAPRLCPSCGSPSCGVELRAEESPRCSRPWILRPEIESYSARYLLLGKSYEVLKRWKIHGGILLSRRILRPSTLLQSVWEKFSPEAIVPVPQFFNRSWKMGGSRTGQIARWLSGQVSKPVCEALQMNGGNRNQREKGPRQAQLDLSSRYERRIPFTADPHLLKTFRRIILVDDFMTTGRTLSLAAKQLKHGREDLRIHVFCLGIRPGQNPMRTQIGSDLLDRERGSIPICEEENPFQSLERTGLH